MYRPVKETRKTASNTLIYERSYDSDAVGNRKVITEFLTVNGNTTTLAETTYDYDDLYRLTKETRTGSNAYMREYWYDEVGNRTEQKTTVGGSVVDDRTYTVDERDRLLTETPASGPQVSYAYDLNGNSLSKGDSTNGTTSYTWDALDRMIGENNDKFTGEQFDPNLRYYNFSCGRKRADSPENVHELHFLIFGRHKTRGFASSS